MIRGLMKKLRQFWGDLFSSKKSNGALKQQQHGSTEKKHRRNIKETMNRMSETLVTLQKVHTPIGNFCPEASDMEAFLATTGPVWLPNDRVADGISTRPDYFTLNFMPSRGAVVLDPTSYADEDENDERKRERKRVRPTFMCWSCSYDKLGAHRGVEILRHDEILVEIALMYRALASQQHRRYWWNFVLALSPATGEARQLRSRMPVQAPNGGTQWNWQYQVQPGGEPIDTEEARGHLFWAMNAWSMRDFGWQIQMRYKKRIITFPISENDAKHWFRDRVTAATPSGQRKRILHEVKSHTRKDGSVVRPHLRGESHFLWNGCPTAILVHQQDTLLLSQFNVLSYRVNKLSDLGQESIGEYQLGKRLDVGKATRPT